MSLVGSLQTERRHPRECFQEFQAKHRRRPQSVGVWIGPEGDFTLEELQAIQNSGAHADFARPTGSARRDGGDLLPLDSELRIEPSCNARLNRFDRGLHQHAEGAAQMFGMREGLKLARLAAVHSPKEFVSRRPFPESASGIAPASENISVFNPASSPAFWMRGKIDVRGQVLFAGVGQKIVADMMAEIGAQRAARARGRKQFVGGEAVVNRQQFAALQNARGFAPPVFGGGRSFDGVAVGQDGTANPAVRRSRSPDSGV